jgi:hypothetical protein
MRELAVRLVSETIDPSTMRNSAFVVVEREGGDGTLEVVGLGSLQKESSSEGLSASSVSSQMSFMFNIPSVSGSCCGEVDTAPVNGVETPDPWATTLPLVSR